MSTPSTYTRSDFIAASPAQVWETLTNPELVYQYMFGCAPDTDWEIGGQFDWKGVSDGQTYVHGTLLVNEPDKKLTFTVFPAGASYENIPENHLRTQYTLEESENGTMLHVHQSDFSSVADGENRYNEASSAWDMTMSSLKQVAEKHAQAAEGE